MTTSTNYTLLKIVNVLFWIAFIGLCVRTGSILVPFIISLFISPAGAQKLYFAYGLADLFALSKPNYILLGSLLIAINGLKAYIAYLIVKLFLTFDLSRPFGRELPGVFLKISYVALGTGILAMIAAGLCKAIMRSTSGVSLSTDWHGSEILFFAGVIYLLALVFRKGTDLQTESDLTV